MVTTDHMSTMDYQRSVLWFMPQIWHLLTWCMVINFPHLL